MSWHRMHQGYLNLEDNVSYHMANIRTDSTDKHDDIYKPTPKNLNHIGCQITPLKFWTKRSSCSCCTWSLGLVELAEIHDIYPAWHWQHLDINLLVKVQAPTG